MAALQSTTAEDELYHVSLCPQGTETIVFLHGIFSCNLEFAPVADHISGHHSRKLTENHPQSSPDYHLMLVDLPGHSGSKHLGPCAIPECAAHVARTIRRHAKNGKAHIAGLSYGGFVAMQLASDFPEVVSTLWISGAPPFQGWQAWMAAHPRILYCFVGCIAKWMPDWMYDQLCKRTGMLPHNELRQEMKKNFSMSLLRVGYGSILDVTVQDVTMVLAKTDIRILLLAGALQDDIKTIKQMAQLLKDGGSKDSRGVTVKRALHGWDLQFPEKFARSIDAWIKGVAQPEGIEDIS